MKATIFIMWVALGLVVICMISIASLQSRIERLEQLPKSELVCSIPDSKGRYVCRYVEID